MTRPLDEKSYRDKVLGCWRGKSIGGTLGMPFEGDAGPLDLTFYRPLPATAAPNDDLDLQIVWTCHLLDMERPVVSPEVQAQAWRDHLTGMAVADEYAVCVRNLEYGLAPPLTGQYDNWFTRGMGAAIRSEIWACLAPGDPGRACAFAYCDACCDHAGEGVWAEIFLAAIESLGFVESSRDRLLDESLSRLPAGSLVRAAIQDTRAWHAQGLDWLASRQRILEKYGRTNFTDVVQNLCFIVLGWLYGDGDFGKSLCTAVNCGQDTDCTGATLGSILGIIDPTAIPPGWLKPIGNTIRLSSGLRSLRRIPATVDELTDLVVDLREKLSAYTYPWDGEVLPTVLPSCELAPVVVPVRRSFVSSHDQALDCVADVDLLDLPGHWNVFSPEEFRSDVMVIRAALDLHEPATVRVGTYGTTSTRGWVNGQAVTSWSGGACIPAAHRPVEGTSGDVQLPAGTHELVVSIEKGVARPVELVLQIADPRKYRWLPWALAKLK